MALELTKKAGPLPVWGWAVVIAVGGYVAYKKFFSGSTATTTTTNATSPGVTDTSGGVGATPVYIGSTGTSTPVDTSSVASTVASVPAVASGWVDAAGNAVTSIGQAVTGAETAPAGSTATSGQLPACTPGSSSTCSLQYMIDQSGIVYAPSASGWVGGYFPNPQAPWQEQANAAIKSFLGQEPAQVPVGDQYGGIGLQTPAAAAAGGYWGANGQWVPTATPWNPVAGNPPLGNLTPGTPYATGSAYGNTVGSNPIIGTPVKYQ